MDHISCVGFACFRAFLENVNQNDHRLKKTGNTYTVEKMDLVGLDYLWRVVLEVPSEEIAMMAVKQLMELSYTWLSSKLKKVKLMLVKPTASFKKMRHTCLHTCMYLNLKLWENSFSVHVCMCSTFRTLLTVTRNLFWSVTNVLK